MLARFLESVLELVIKTSTDLAPDVRAAMKVALNVEPAGTQAAQALTIIAENIDQAANGEGAICQDTGLPTFEIRVPKGADQVWMTERILEAIAEATRRGSSGELGGFHHGNELRQQPRAGDARGSLPPVGPR